MTPEEFDEAAHRLLQAEQVPMMPDFCALAIVLHPKVLTWQSLTSGGSTPAPLGRGGQGGPRRRPLRRRRRRRRFGGWRPGRRGRRRVGERRRGGDDAPLGAGEGPPRRRRRRWAPGTNQEQQKERGQGHQRLSNRCLPPSPVPDSRLERDISSE